MRKNRRFGDLSRTDLYWLRFAAGRAPWANLVVYFDDFLSCICPAEIQIAGQQILKKLVEQSDVLVENFRPGVMKRLGLGYESLKSINKKLIYASINGFGEEGPYVERRVYDAVIQAVSGMGALQADPSVDQPIFINQLICDKLTSVTAAQVISSALVARERSGIFSWTRYPS